MHASKTNGMVMSREGTTKNHKSNYFIDDPEIEQVKFKRTR